MTEHGIERAYWDNIARGWRIECLCGYETGACILCEFAGAEFDSHLEAVGKEPK